MISIGMYLENYAKTPTRAYETDAGFDLYSPVNIELNKIDSIDVDTGVHLSIPEGYVGIIYPRSGLNVKYGITATGVVDAGYTGTIVVKLYRQSKDFRKYRISRGDRIAQIVVVPIADISKIDKVNGIEQLKSFRGNQGFGSSGK